MGVSTGQVYNLDELVPHRGDMCLLDAVVDHGDNWLSARARLSETNLFLTDGQIPSWVGIEYMAQSVAAFMGIRSRQKGEPARVGFLVGTRKYQAERPAFPVGSVLELIVQEAMTDENGLGVFDCALTCEQPDGLTFAASARLTIFQPDDVRDVYGEET